MMNLKPKAGIKARDLSVLLSILDGITEVQVEVNGKVYLANTCEISAGGDTKEFVIIHCHPSTD